MPRNSRRRGDTYTLKISHKDAYGTYDLAVLMQPPAQSFAVSLPASISNGVPLAGAGDLETTASEDDYTFTTGAQGTLQMAFSGCPGGQVYWTLTNTDTNGRVGSGWTCATITEQNLPAADYKLAITDQGHSGPYQLTITTS